MKRMTLDEFLAEAKKRFGSDSNKWRFICPVCHTVQSIEDFSAIGVKDPQRYIGFSCIGRWTGKDSPGKQPYGEGCNWTLGGLFRVHKLEVEDRAGEIHPHFELAPLFRTSGNDIYLDTGDPTKDMLVIRVNAGECEPGPGLGDDTIKLYYAVPQELIDKAGGCTRKDLRDGRI